MSYPVSLPIEVAWGDMDAFGHVNNVMFFRYFESTRIAYMRRLKAWEADDKRFTPFLASNRCDYLAPVVFPDTVVGEARVSKMGNSSLTMEYQLVSRAQEKVVARGEAVVVNVDPASGKSRPIPSTLRKRIEELEGRSLS